MKEVQDKVKLAPGATVMLSACNSGRGKIMGEGCIGLSRGFLFVGAGAVVSSLWRVDDEATKTLFCSFYQHFCNGYRSPQALRRGILAMIQDGYEPCYWASFLVCGASTSLR